MNKCEFCNSPIPYNVNNCPACGAPCKYIPDPRAKQQISAGEKTVTGARPSGYVESMADVDIDLKESSKDRFSDDLEADLENARKRNAAAAKNTIIGCTVLLIVVSIVIAIIVSVVS